MNRSKIVIFIHLLIIVSLLVRPIVPFIDYLINRDYIAQNLCVNRDVPDSCCKGKCYLKKQLSKESEKKEAEPNAPKKKQLSKDMPEFFSMLSAVSLLNAGNWHYPVLSDKGLPENNPDQVFIPPKA